MNKELLRDRITDAGKTYEDCANELGVHRNTFCAKLSGRNEFTVGEADRLREILNLSNDMALKIFFDGMSQN